MGNFHIQVDTGLYLHYSLSVDNKKGGD